MRPSLLKKRVQLEKGERTRTAGGELEVQGSDYDYLHFSHIREEDESRGEEKLLYRGGATKANLPQKEERGNRK